MVAINLALFMERTHEVRRTLTALGKYCAIQARFRPLASTKGTQACRD